MSATPPGPTPSRYWNVFAAVLQSMLEGLVPSRGLGHLDNRPDPVTGKTIHPQKVARLQRSLFVPIFPTLNPDEIARVVRTFDLSADQEVRLHAAVLATAVQAMLAGRIGPQDARVAGWQVLPIVEQQLHEHRGEEGLGASRDPRWQGGVTLQDDVDAFTAEYGAALTEIDRGMLDLALAEGALMQRERRASARTARAAFEAALELLSAVKDETDETMLEAGHFWLDAARQGITAAQGLLA